MSTSVVVGLSQAYQGQEAASQAARGALDLVGRAPVALGIVIASWRYKFEDIVAGMTPVIGDVPLIGFSTSSVITSITSQTHNQHSMIVALVTGDNLTAQANWLPGYDINTKNTTQKMLSSFQQSRSKGIMLIAADGIAGDGEQLCDALVGCNYELAGLLAGGDVCQNATSQIGGKLTGNNGIAAALITGNLAIGVGVAHGWQPMGVNLKVTQSEGHSIFTLNGKNVPDFYSDLFHYPSQEWTVSPLNELVRLYPLGLLDKEQGSLTVRSPLRIQSDGSLRMPVKIHQGSTSHLLCGNVDTCLEAARSATDQAIKDLGRARPILAIVIPDIAWQMLFQAMPGKEIEVIRDVLGLKLPIIGGYTLGQIYQISSSKHINNPEFLNQHLEIILIGEKY